MLKVGITKCSEFRQADEAIGLVKGCRVLVEADNCSARIRRLAMRRVTTSFNHLTRTLSRALGSFALDQGSAEHIAIDGKTLKGSRALAAKLCTSCLPLRPNSAP